jgi:small subunit ribosomal protein S20
MANTVSSKKRIRQTARKTEKNRKARSRFKTFIKTAREEIQSKSTTSSDAVKAAIAELGKAASKGIIHKKNAARRISRLQLSLNNVGATAAAPSASTAAPAAAKATAKKAAPKAKAKTTKK